MNHDNRNHTHEQLKPPTTAHPPPKEAAPPTPTIRKDGSVQYDEPIIETKKPQPPPVAPKPPHSPVSPLSGPHYHSLEPQDGVSPLLSPSITSPQFPVAATNLSTLSPSNSHYHVLEAASSPLSSLDRRSPHQSSLSLSAFDSLDRRRIAHSREHSNSSELRLMQLAYDDPGYDVVLPPRLDSQGGGGNTLRMLSTGSTHTGAHSRTSSQATLGDEEPTDHVYHQLTSQEVCNYYYTAL